MTWNTQFEPVQQQRLSWREAHHLARNAVGAAPYADPWTTPEYTMPTGQELIDWYMTNKIDSIDFMLWADAVPADVWVRSVDQRATQHDWMSDYRAEMAADRELSGWVFKSVAGGTAACATAAFVINMIQMLS